MESKIRKFISTYWILALLLLIKFILQYTVVNPVYELHRDEFLYLNQADHLAFSYISVPPFTALVSKVIYLFGGGIFWIRFFPALFGVMTIIFTWLIVESLGGSLIAKIVAASALVFSVLLRVNILLQPNSCDIFIWTLIFYLLIKYIQSEKSSFLWILAVVVAIGFYNKYNLIFLLAGLVPGLLLTDQRKIFAKPVFWKCMVFCLILLAPNIIWQISNHFPVFQHMKVLKANQLDNNSSLGFLKSQVMFFIGSLALTVGSLIAFFTLKSFKEYRFIGITIIVSLAIFALLKAKDYYSLGLYPVMIAMGSVVFDQILVKKWKVIVLPIIAVINILIFLIFLKFVFPILNPVQIRANASSFERMGLFRWEDGKNHNLPQDFADMLGWSEMADKAFKAYKMIPEGEQENTIILCSNYGQAGALNYYNRGKLPEAYAFNTDYIYWIPKKSRIQNIVFLGEKPDANVIALFNECRLVGQVEEKEARERGTEIYLLLGAKEIFTNAFYLKLEERKKKMDIF
jgi:4-amino-4-deoxy-L-arabinose transferase-like glycosyltransferase